MSNLKNTPWIIEVDLDGTCDIYATDKEREPRLRWIAASIDEPTAKAIAALPETLAEIEAVKAERDELKAFVRDFYEIQKDNYGNATNTHLKMIDLAGKAQELLKTPKQ